MLRRFLDLIGSRGVVQGLIGCLKLLLKLFVFLLQGRQLHAGGFILPKCRDGFSDLVRIDLCDEIDAYDDRISVEGRMSLLVEHKHQPRRVGTDFVFGDVHPFHDGDTFQVGGNLFQRVPFGRFGSEANSIFSRIPFPHPMLSLSRDYTEFGERW